MIQNLQIYTNQQIYTYDILRSQFVLESAMFFLVSVNPTLLSLFPVVFVWGTHIVTHVQ